MKRTNRPSLSRHGLLFFSSPYLAVQPYFTTTPLNPGLLVDTPTSFSCTPKYTALRYGVATAGRSSTAAGPVPERLAQCQ